MADSQKQSALRQLAASLPVANKQVAQQQQAARDMQLQQAVAAAPAASPIATTAQTTGAAAAGMAGQQQVQTAEQGLQQQGQVAGLGQQAGALESQANVASLQAGAKDQQLDGIQKLAAVSEQAKQEMYDSRRQFAQDQMGQKFTNERQLSDYVRLKAGTEDQWQDYVQKSDQLYDRKTQMLTTAQQKLSSQLQFEQDAMNQIKDQMASRAMSAQERAAQQKILSDRLAQAERLRQAENNLRISIAKEAADKANRKARNTAIGSAVGTVAGGVAGGVFGGPGGAVAGASVGGSLGGVAGSSVG